MSIFAFIYSLYTLPCIFLLFNHLKCIIILSKLQDKKGGVLNVYDEYKQTKYDIN